MKFPIGSLLAAVLALAACQNGAYGPWPQEMLPGTVRRYPCRYTTTAPVMDGSLDDAEWSNAPWSEPFLNVYGSLYPLPRYATWMKMLWDDHNLYIAAYVEEPDLWATYDRRDMAVFEQNDFEVFIDPDGDGESYYELQVNALGTIFDLYLDREFRRGGRAHAEWNCEGIDGGIERMGTLNDPSDVDAGWTVEIKIPFMCLRPPATVTDDQPENIRNGDTPAVGEVWRMNFARVEWRLEKVGGGYVKSPGTKEETWVWTPEWSGEIHHPADWGQVTFTR